MPAPKAGSRKAEVYEAYQKGGFEAAQKIGKRLSLSDNTVKTWTSTWYRGGLGSDRPQKIAKPERVLKPGKIPKPVKYIHPSKDPSLVIPQGKKRAGCYLDGLGVYTPYEE